MVVTHAHQSGVVGCLPLALRENWVLVAREVSTVKPDHHGAIRDLVLKCLAVSDCDIPFDEIFLSRLLLPSAFFGDGVKPGVLVRIRVLFVHSVFLNIIEHNFRSLASHALGTTIYDLLRWERNPWTLLFSVDPVLYRCQRRKYEGGVEPFFVTNDRLFRRPVVIVEAKSGYFSKFFIISNPLHNVIQTIELILRKVSKPFNILLIIQVQFSILDHTVLILIETKIHKLPLLFLILWVIFIHVIDILNLLVDHGLLTVEWGVRDVE